MGWFGKTPRHCRVCEKRFYAAYKIAETEFTERT